MSVPAHILTAIWAAARARFGGDAQHMVRTIVAQETHDRTSSTRELTRQEAHRVLDRLNEKDPQTEDAKRATFTGGVRRGERARHRSPQIADANDDEDAPKIIRAASQDQMALFLMLATQCGMTRTAEPGQYILSEHALEEWMVRRFGLANWQVGKVLREDIARRAIAGLKSWARTRRAAWRDAWNEPVAHTVLAIGLPYECDAEHVIPAEAAPRFEGCGVSGGQ